MKQRVRLLWIVAAFAWAAPAGAQTAPPTSSARFDGTYAFVSATRLSQTTADGMGVCPDLTAGVLTIAHGEALYSEGVADRRAQFSQFQGAVSAEGGFRAKSTNPWVSTVGEGQVEADGTVRLRSLGSSCDDDFLWRRASH
ncbi:MAG TPA: hypothetical protein VMF86_09140 [Stellaceae bacterium]|nr:hypothetical protein [Stellaceae bacterium]